MAHSLGGEGFDDFTDGDIAELMADKELSEDGLVNLVCESESDKSDEEELVPVAFTAKVIREGLTLGRKLGNHFMQNDTNVERALRFQPDINRCLAQYEEVYKDLTKNSKQLLITDFITISHNLQSFNVKGANVAILTTDGGKKRYINDLSIKAFCPVGLFPQSVAGVEKINEYVRGRVVKVDPTLEKLVITMKGDVPQNKLYPADEYAEPVRKLQNKNWAYRSVKEGVSYFKQGKQTEALQCLNQALHIDSENVEAYVARGALLANNSSFKKAIEDFEKALNINPLHANGRKYLTETLVALGKSLQEKGSLEEAVSVYKSALCSNPDSYEAKLALKQLDTLMTKKILVGWTCTCPTTHCVYSLPQDKKRSPPPRTSDSKVKRPEKELLGGDASSGKSHGANVAILTTDGGKKRYINDLSIKAFCPVGLFPQSVAGVEKINEYVRGRVVKVDPTLEKLVITMKGDVPQNKLKDLVETQNSILKMDTSEWSYKQDPIVYKVTRSNPIKNPSCDKSISHTLGLSHWRISSFIHSFNDFQYPADEYAEPVRKLQNKNWAYRSVKEGVSYFKQGKQTEALQCLNQALHIDSENVEAYVARGALLANNSSFKKAIEDFEKALNINPLHANGRKYLTETLVALGKSLQEKGSLEEAVSVYKSALCSNPDSYEAKLALKQLDTLMTKKILVGWTCTCPTTHCVYSLPQDKKRSPPPRTSDSKVKRPEKEIRSLPTCVTKLMHSNHACSFRKIQIVKNFWSLWKMAISEPKSAYLREVLLFAFNWKKSASEAHRMVEEVYSDHALSKSQCYRWFKKFQSGDFELDNEPHGKPPQKFEDAELQALLDEDSTQMQEKLAKQLQMPRPNRFGKKAMLCIWWNRTGEVYFELLKPGKMVNTSRYEQQMHSLREALNEKRPEWRENHKNLILQHDNAPSHNATVVKNTIKDLGWELLPHPPYSPDLAPSNYHLFTSLGHALKK
ncbi:TTC14 [Cordylochernes scorpioides]|uniref:TTC14 n=1 Tax=Cordylochernes scorpioides TaxID=51811 RepID=A0ABY6KDI0_9ARAC|nr:TTC14 [Cordylochernes scorpioides]